MIALINCLLHNSLFSTLVSYSEIIQFLCLFSLISIPFYPSFINLLYNAQNFWNFNFVSLPTLYFIDCNDVSSNEKLEGNFNQHPAIDNTNFICNSYSLLFSCFWLLLTYFISYLLTKIKCFKILKKSFEFNQFLQFMNGSIIVILVICFIAQAFV